MKECENFPHDCDTLGIIKELEVYLSLDNKDLEKMNKIELSEYIDQITLMLLKN